MSQLSVKLSAKADALVAQLQKEIFNRRRKKVTPSQVVETLVESGAKSQSDKRYAASWKNLIKDIEKAAKVAEVHGNKPASVSAEEWALIISHRTRKGTTAKKAVNKTTVKKSTAKKATAKKADKTAVVKKATKKAEKKVDSVKSTSSVAKRMAKSSAGRPARRARKAKTTEVKA